jgi:hypothetical protein
MDYSHGYANNLRNPGDIPTVIDFMTDPIISSGNNSPQHGDVADFVIGPILIKNQSEVKGFIKSYSSFQHYKELLARNESLFNGGNSEK